LLHAVEARHVRGDDVRVVLALKVLRAGLERRHHRGFLVVAGGVHADLALAVELPRHGAGLPERPAVLAEDVADLRDRAGRGVRQSFEVQRDAAGSLALVRAGLVVGALDLTRAALDGALDVLRGHVRGFGGLHREPQPRVEVRVTAALAGRDGDLADELGEHLAALRVVRGLLTLDLRPLAVPGQGAPPPDESKAVRDNGLRRFSLCSPENITAAAG